MLPRNTHPSDNVTTIAASSQIAVSTSSQIKTTALPILNFNPTQANSSIIVPQNTQFRLLDEDEKQAMQEFFQMDQRAISSDFAGNNNISLRERFNRYERDSQQSSQVFEQQYGQSNNQCGATTSISRNSSTLAYLCSR